MTCLCDLGHLGTFTICLYDFTTKLKLGNIGFNGDGLRCLHEMCSLPFFGIMPMSGIKACLAPFGVGGSLQAVYRTSSQKEILLSCWKCM